jgi:hypothetical protein
MSDSNKFDVANSQFVGLKAFAPQFLVLFSLFFWGLVSLFSCLLICCCYVVRSESM